MMVPVVEDIPPASSNVSANELIVPESIPGTIIRAREMKQRIFPFFLFCFSSSVIKGASSEGSA